MWDYNFEIKASNKIRYIRHLSPTSCLCGRYNMFLKTQRCLSMWTISFSPIQLNCIPKNHILTLQSLPEMIKCILAFRTQLLSDNLKIIILKASVPFFIFQDKTINIIVLCMYCILYKEIEKVYFLTFWLILHFHRFIYHSFCSQ